MREESVATVHIESIAAGGDGVARIAGMACFIPRTAVGDVAHVAYVTHGRYARGRVLQVLEPSAERVAPACPHYEQDACGGCQLQHLSAAAQQTARQRIVHDTLQRVGRREAPELTLWSAEPWGYRERLSLTLRPRGSQVIGGLVPITPNAKPFALEQCLIAHPALVSCWLAIRGSLRGVPLSPQSPSVRLSLRLMDSSGSRVALVLSGGTSWREGATWAEHVAVASPLVAAVWWEPGGSVHDAEGGERTTAPRVHLYGDPSPGVLAFAQVNRTVSTALREDVARTVRALSPRSVVDAYAGRGDLAMALAADGVQVTVIEADPAATSEASRQLSAYPSARVITAMVEDALPDVLPADVVVLNPPRRGVDVRVTARLESAFNEGVRAIVYVSCDPATLARDLSRLPRWRIDAIRTFDMFPQTAHVETVCVLVPGES